MLVDEQGVWRDAFEQVQAIEVSHVRMEEIAIEQAVIIDARGGEGVADEEDVFTGILFDQERLVVEGLAREEIGRELKFLPAPSGAAG